MKETNNNIKALFSFFTLSIVILLAGCAKEESRDGSTPTAIEPLSSPAIELTDSLEYDHPPAVFPTRTPWPMPYTMIMGPLGSIQHTSVPLDLYQKLWKSDYQIYDLAYGNGIWITIVSNISNFESQSLVESKNFPGDDIDHALEENMFITELVYGDDIWVVVLSKTSKFSSQNILTSSKFPQTEIDAMSEKGYWISSLAYGNGLWSVVFSQSENPPLQKITFESTFSIETIEQAIENNMYLSEAVLADGIWTFVFSEEMLSEQEILALSHWPKDTFLDYAYERNYTEIKFFYTDSMWVIVGGK